MKYTITIASLIATAGFANAATTLFTSNFDANTGAHVFTGDTDNTSGSSSLGVTWTQDAAVTAISGLTAVSTTDGGTSTQGGFAQTQNGAGVFANPNVAYISRNHNLATPRTDAQLGYSFTFTLNTSFDLEELVVASTHTNNSGNSDQAFASDLVISVSGGTLGSAITDTINEDYGAFDAYHDVTFDLTGNTLGAGTYTVQVHQSNMPSGGAYASYDGVTLTAVPEPSSTALLGLGGLALILRRRK